MLFTSGKINSSGLRFSIQYSPFMRNHLISILRLNIPTGCNWLISTTYRQNRRSERNNIFKIKQLSVYADRAPKLLTDQVNVSLLKAKFRLLFFWILLFCMVRLAQHLFLLALLIDISWPFLLSVKLHLYLLLSQLLSSLLAPKFWFFLVLRTRGFVDKRDSLILFLKVGDNCPFSVYLFKTVVVNPEVLEQYLVFITTVRVL